MLRRIKADETKVSVQLSRIESRLDRKRQELTKTETRLLSIVRETAEDLAIMDEELSRARKEIEQLTKRQKQYETEVDALRSRVRVAEDVTIPGLVAANKLVLERYDADTAVQVKRQVLQS